MLVDVHGQSEHLSLLRVREHLPLLDRYAEDESQRQAFAAAYQSLVKVRQELEMLRQGERDAARRADMLAFTFRRSRPPPCDPARRRCCEERTRLANAEHLAALATQALPALDEGGETRPAAMELLGQAAHAAVSWRNSIHR